MECLEISSEQIKRNDHTSINVENLYFPLVNSVRRELETLNPLSDQCCIYRAPKQLRQLNEKIYTPQLVSIGPLHHGKDELKPMEEHKRRYLQDFLHRTEVSMEIFVLFIKEREAKLRNCYAETIGLNSDDFVKMIFIDATFIIEVLLRNSFPEFRSTNDRLFTKPWMIIYVRYDIWLLENQLPFFILEDLFKLANIAMSSNHDRRPSIIKLIHELANVLWDLVLPPRGLLAKHPSPLIEHFVDFLRICHQPLKPCPKNKVKILTAPSVTKLKQAGVKFKLGSSKNMFDIRFNNGTLEIPKLKIDLGTELLFRNLLAFEECHDCNNYINDYVIIIKYLVNAPKDVELLVQNGIVDNWMLNSEVLTLFRKIADRATIVTDDFYFAGLVEDLNAYCRFSWHKWKANLKKDYFSTPWAVISVIAAVILLVFSFIQAICSIISVLDIF